MSDRKPDHIPKDLWDLCYVAWLETEDKRPSELGDEAFKAIAFAANRVFYNQGKSWAKVSTDYRPDNLRDA